MPLTVTPNEDAVITALRAFLVAVVASDIEVVQSQDNRVPQPVSPNFILTTPGRRTRLATNRDEPTDPLGNVTTIFQATQFDYQLDVHGPLGGDACQIITTLMRDEYATRFFDANFPGVSPLYANDPRQLPFSGDGESQYEDRWVIEVSLQADPAVAFTQQYATTLVITPKSVEAEFPAS